MPRHTCSSTRSGQPAPTDIVPHRADPGRAGRCLRRHWHQSAVRTVKETFNPDHGIPLNAKNVLGGLSAIFWALMIVVSVKYVILIMRADNKGEGGIMALLALASSAVKDHPQWHATIMYRVV
jgi:hypothetical protein